MGFQKGPDPRRGKGGARPGAGRKPALTKDIERAFLEGRLTTAQRIIDEDGLSNTDPIVRLDTAKWVFERLNGKAKQAVEANLAHEIIVRRDSQRQTA